MLVQQTICGLGNPKILSGFHKGKVIVIIILRHLPFSAVLVFALIVASKGRKLLAPSVCQGSGTKLAVVIAFFTSVT